MDGAVLHDVERIAERVLRMVKGEPVETIDGSSLTLRGDTVCVHGDTAEALAIVQSLKTSLISAGFAISSV